MYRAGQNRYFLESMLVSEANQKFFVENSRSSFYGFIIRYYPHIKVRSTELLSREIIAHHLTHKLEHALNSGMLEGVFASNIPELILISDTSRFEYLISQSDRPLIFTIVQILLNTIVFSGTLDASLIADLLNAYTDAFENKVLISNLIKVNGEWWSALTGERNTRCGVAAPG